MTTDDDDDERERDERCGEGRGAGRSHFVANARIDGLKMITKECNESTRTC